jgi:Domain of unknown function (DUF4430)
MSRSRVTAVAIALFAAALATAGCGIGPGGDIGDVSLMVTRDYGAERLLSAGPEQVSESDTVMRLLDRRAEISTRYGGGFVQSIDGVSETVRDGRRYDWFFYVNGVESQVGAADYALHGGDSVWWDYRDWSAAERVPAVVGAWPQPFRDGYEGKRRPVAIECLDGGAACGDVQARLRAAGATLLSGPGGGSDGATGGSSLKRTAPADTLRVLVGPWAAVRGDPTVAQLEEGPQTSGVFADFVPDGHGDYRLEGLDEGGEEAKAFGPGAGLVAATRRYDAPPVWIVSGTSQRGVAAAAQLLDTRDLRDHYAVAIEGGQETPLPIGAAAP